MAEPETQTEAPAPVAAPKIAYMVRGMRFGPYPQHTPLTTEQVQAVLTAEPPWGDLAWPGGPRVTLAGALQVGVLEAVPADAPEVIAATEPTEAEDHPRARQRKAQ